MKALLHISFFVAAIIVSCGNSGGVGTDKNFAVQERVVAPNKTADVDTLENGAVITFSENEYVFGTVKRGREISHVFEYTNTGTEPLIINDVVASCGCTVPEFSSEPIYPGKSGIIKVTFNTKGYRGLQTKTITVKSNAQNSVVLLRIIAQIQ